MSFYRPYRINKKLIKCIDIDDDGWILCNFDNPIYHLETFIRFKQRINKLFNRHQIKVDKIIKTVDSIKRNGWDHNLAWMPNGSIIGYSLVDEKYFLMTGRHRIAALKYLYEKGIVDKNQEVEFPIINTTEKIWGSSRIHPLTPPII
mgnify:CR=1 FL=1